MERRLEMVGPNGLEPSTSSVSRKRSNQTELRAYTRTVLRVILWAARNSGNVLDRIKTVRPKTHPATGLMTDTWLHSRCLYAPKRDKTKPLETPG
jgi:hypothetical protein